MSSHSTRCPKSKRESRWQLAQKLSYANHRCQHFRAGWVAVANLPTPARLLNQTIVDAERLDPNPQAVSPVYRPASNVRSGTPMSLQFHEWQVNSSTWCRCAASNSTRFI